MSRGFVGERNECATDGHRAMLNPDLPIVVRTSQPGDFRHVPRCLVGFRPPPADMPTGLQSAHQWELGSTHRPRWPLVRLVQDLVALPALLMSPRSWFQGRVHRCAVVLLVLVLSMVGSVLRASAQESYKLGVRDIVNVSVFGHAELTGRFTVGDDGTITFPLLGSVSAGGLTIAELQAAIVRGLSDGFLRAPQVSVDMVQFVSQRVYAIGEVRTPGAVTLSGTSSLLDVLVKAGSLTEQAGGDIRLLRRKGANATGPLAPGQPDVEEVARINVQQVRRGLITFNGSLADGDTIFVPRAESVYVLGNVNRPGTYTLDPGVTTVMTAIAQAGGISELGSTKRIRVSRTQDGRVVELEVKLSDLLQPGDTLVVGLRRF